MSGRCTADLRCCCPVACAAWTVCSILAQIIARLHITGRDAAMVGATAGSGLHERRERKKRQRDEETWKEGFWHRDSRETCGLVDGSPTIFFQRKPCSSLDTVHIFTKACLQYLASRFEFESLKRGKPQIVAALLPIERCKKSE